MSKPRGRRHKWEQDGEWATCINCGLKVETKRIRRGGLPTCDEFLSSKAHQISTDEEVDESAQVLGSEFQPISTDEEVGESAQVLGSEALPISTEENSGSYLQEYLASYRKGCELYGVWWKLFTFSMLSFSVIFLTVAIILVLLYLI
jgi:hypothetical protein